MPIEHPDNTEEEREEIKRTKETEKQREKRVAEALIQVMSTEEGRTVLWAIVEEAKIQHTPAFFGDHDRTWHNIGRQDFGRQILTMLFKAAPRYYHLMQRENETWK